MRLRIVALLPLALAATAHGSDHIDGHEVRRDRRADLADLYAWTPRPGTLAVALTAGPLTRRRARPQEGLQFAVRLRRTDVAGSVGPQELMLSCVGVRGAHRADQFTCTLGDEGLSVDWGSSASTGDVKLFAGVRHDPFFIALGRVSAPQPRDGVRRAVRGVDFLHNTVIRAKVSAVVLEIDAERVPGDGPFIGVVAESWRGDDRIDRIGRAELGNFVLADKFGTAHHRADVRAAWNDEDAFAISPGHRSAYELAASDGLARLDRMDGGSDWPTAHPLQSVFLDDWLTVDPRIACTVDSPSFLEIEAARMAGVPHQTCGGRTPNDDAVDRLLTWTMNGPHRVAPGPPLHGPPGQHAPARGDGVDRPRHPATDSFPYLEEP